MKGQRRRTSLYGLMGLLLLIGGLSLKMVAFAGGINSNEAGVISAASGTFTYDGKTYRAGSAYINQLVAYLSGDDVDLTAEQASEAINMMYGSVAQGVEDGYLYEVGNPTTEETTSEEVTTEEETSEEEYADAENDEDEAEEKTTEAADIWDSVTEEAAAEEQLEKRPEKKDASASIQMDDKDIVVVTKDNKEIHITKDKTILSGKVFVILNVIAGLTFIITIICAVILFATKCMSFKVPKGRRARPGHSKRRKIRRHTRNVLTVTAFVSLIGCFAFLGIYVSLFNENALMQNMQSSGYFRYAYAEHIAELSEQNKADTIEPYEEYRYMIKENSLKVLNGETDILIPDSNVTPYIYNLKISYWRLFEVAGSLLILSLVLSIVLMIFMDQRRERGIKSFAVSEVIAGIILVAATIIMAVGKPYTKLYIEPDYLYLFLMECIQWSVKVMTSISAFAVVAGMALIGVYRAIMNRG